jgi:hypothetical protein
MLNQENFKSLICSKWEKLSAIDFNYYDSEKKDSKKLTLIDFKKNLVEVSKNKKIVINSGHFIPNNNDYEDIGKNPSKTWRLGCELIRKLKDNDIDASVSLMLNDIDLTIEARKIIFERYLMIPDKFLKIISKNKLLIDDVFRCGWNNEIIFSEKKLSNRLTHLIQRGKLKKKYVFANNYCVSALVMYFLDLIEHGVDISVFIMPKCAWHNYKNAVDLFEKLNGKKLQHICYLETPNCFL